MQEKLRLFSPEQQNNLGQKFGIRSAFDFRVELKRGNYHNASKWYNYIRENRNEFPNCNDEWFRQQELELFDSYIG